MKTVLGISGFIGAGKSTAGRYLETLGAVFINADEIVDDLYKTGNDGYLKITQYFGDLFLDDEGQINKAVLAKYVFDDVYKIKIINKMIHPLVLNEIMKKIDKVRNGVVVIEAVYFDDDMLLKVVDKLLWIDCDENILRERALKKGMSENMFRKVLNIQKRPSNIDFVIENKGNMKEFEKLLLEVWELISKH